MGVSYREELKKQAKKKKGNPSPELVPRSEAAERAAIRKEYFRVARAGYHKATQRAMRRILDA